MSGWDWVVLIPVLAAAISIAIWLNKIVWPEAIRRWRNLPEERRKTREFLEAHPAPDTPAARRANRIGLSLFVGGASVFFAVIVIVLVAVFA